MIRPLLQFRERLSNHERDALDSSRMLTSVVRGFVRTLLVPPSSNPLRRSRPVIQSSSLTVISRLSSRRTGTRFNSRGLDDDGNVANFVETETVFWSPSGVCFSCTQVRGSVPVFWESSTSLIPGQQKIQIIRSPEATQPAFDKHVSMLEHNYGAVHIVNLLSATKAGEHELTERYRYHIQHSSLRQQTQIQTDDPEAETTGHHLLTATEFDFHERTKGPGGFEAAKLIKPYLAGSEESFVYFLTEDVSDQTSGEKRIQSETMYSDSEDTKTPVVIMQQSGVFRINCLDCLDRTNLVQSLISQMAIELFLSHRAEAANADFWMRHSTLWADNGDALSKIYAGTGALKSSFTRHGKMSLAGAMADVRKSATRLYVNNFADKGRQNTIDLLLGRLVGQTPAQLFDPVHDYVVEQLNSKKHLAEYTSCKPIYIWCGTLNLNGKLEGIKENLSPWLHAKTKGFAFDYDVVCVGFQEIVELSPQQIMSTDPSIRLLWERKVKEVLNTTSNHGIGAGKGGDEYVLLRSGQLVGAALMIFVKARTLNSIKNVEGAIKKTGMSGIAGNKGAVAVRMDIENTSLCLVTAHLAAGFANYEERNRDYRTVEQGMHFTGGRSIEDHDAIIWLGDFNYRIGLGHEKASRLVQLLQDPTAVNADTEEAMDRLYENDQLNIQMVHGQAFPWYQEMRVRFLPTYKFDIGTDKYDSSEKARIPAWCDRVVYKSTSKSSKDGARSLKGLEYGSVQELRFSDHRPVFATFELDVQVIDEAKRSAISKSIEEKRRADVEGILRKEKSGISTVEDDETASDSGDAEDLMGYESIADGLPPASSDRRKWWLDGEKSVRSMVGPPRPRMVLNRNRSGNPWRDSNGRGEGLGKEDDWVEISTADWDGSETPGSLNRSASEAGSRKTSPRSKSPPPLPAPRGARRMVVPVYEAERLVRMASEKGKGGYKAHSQQNKGPMDGATDAASSIPVLTSLNAERASPADRSRAASIASTRSSITGGRKPVPPSKPSKPAALRSGSTVASPDISSPQAATTSGSDDGPPPLPSRTTTLSSVDSASYFSTAESPTAARPSRFPPPSGIESRNSGVDKEPAPPLPPRRAATNNQLMDEDARVEFSGWKPLRPE